MSDCDDEVYKIDRVSFRYSSCARCECGKVLDGVSLSLRRGWCVAVLGANGCGKSTLLMLMAAHLAPTEGRIYFGGRDIGTIGRAELAGMVSFSAQSYQGAFNFTVEEIIAMGRSPYLNFFGTAGPGVEKETQTDEIIRQAAATLELEGLLERPLGRLSGGERKRTMLACSLAQDAGAMIFDEPDAHLDIRHQHEFLRHVYGLATERGKLCVYSAHNPGLARKFSTHALLMDAAEKTFVFGRTEEVMTRGNLGKIYRMEFSETEINGRRMLAV